VRPAGVHAFGLLVGAAVRVVPQRPRRQVEAQHLAALVGVGGEDELVLGGRPEGLRLEHGHVTEGVAVQHLADVHQGHAVAVVVQLTGPDLGDAVDHPVHEIGA